MRPRTGYGKMAMSGYSNVAEEIRIEAERKRLHAKMARGPHRPLKMSPGLEAKVELKTLPKPRHSPAGGANKR